MKQTTLAIIAVLLMMAGLTLGIGGSIWYIRSQVQHECAALNLILTQPVPKSANPTQIAFHQAILGWAKSDGCL